MDTTTTILPGVRRIFWVDGSKLRRRVDLHGICGTPLPILQEKHEIEFFGVPECSCATKSESGNKSDTATLRFRASALLPIHLNLAFLVEDNNGKKYLIGSKEPPTAKVNVTLGLGQIDSDSSGFEYTVEHTALKSLISCMY